jgi:hypothetical protein
MARKEDVILMDLRIYPVICLERPRITYKKTSGYLTEI